jgi:hypothetical protein
MGWGRWFCGEGERRKRRKGRRIHHGGHGGHGEEERRVRAEKVKRRTGMETNER